MWDATHCLVLIVCLCFLLCLQVLLQTWVFSFVTLSVWTSCVLCHHCKPLATRVNTTCHGCFDGQASGSIYELSGHWIQLRRHSNIFWLWLTLELLKLALELGYGSPFSRPSIFKSLLHVLCHLILWKGRESKQNSFKKKKKDYYANFL